jgi:phage host-nuclease inhibitor protein Gam
MKLTLAAERGVRIPRTKTEAGRSVVQLGMALAKIGSTRRRYDAKVEKLTKRIHDLEKERDEIVAPLAEETRTIANAIHRFAEAERPALTGGGKIKTVLLSGGSFKWYTPGRASFEVPDEEAFYEEAKRKKIEDLFVRVKKEPNRQAMHDNPEAAGKLRSVIAEKRERFAIAPRNAAFVARRVLDEPHAEWEFEEKEK